MSGPKLGENYNPSDKQFLKEKEEKKKPLDQTFIITGSALLLGEPTEGDYSKGLFEFTAETLTADAIQKINEALKKVRDNGRPIRER